MTELLLVFVAAVPIGIFGIVFGGNMFLSFPLFQWLYPEMLIGAIVGNIKPGSVVRNVAGLVPLWHSIDFRTAHRLMIPLTLGSMAGALLIATLSQAFVVPILILAWVVMEYAPRFAQHMSNSRFMAGALSVGVYGGIFGAGVSLLIVALLRLKIPNDAKLITVRAAALYLETVLTIASVVVFLSYGLISWPITLTWMVGSLLGGYLGGRLLNWTGSTDPRLQKGIVHAAFAIALCVALWRLL